MAVQRQAENPGMELQHEQSIKYSLPKKEKLKNKTDQNPVIEASKPVSVQKDLLHTFIVFGIIIAVIVALYLKQH